MNNIVITGRISLARSAETINGKLLNLYVSDDTCHGAIRFHSAFSDEKDMEKILSMDCGDEISYSGTVTGFSPKYKVIEVYPERIISLAKLERKYIPVDTESDDMTEE